MSMCLSAGAEWDISQMIFNNTCVMSVIGNSQEIQGFGDGRLKSQKLSKK